MEKKFDYLIIGGGIAGTSAAETIRQNDKKGSIAIICDEPYRLYSRIMLSKPNWFLKKIPFEKVWLKDEGWYKENKIEFLSGKRANKIETENKKIILEDGEEISYDKLLLATGVSARPWKVDDSDKQGIYSLRNLDDGKAIIEQAKKTKQAVAIGGGFISFEMADLLRELNIEVTLIIREPHYWDPILDEKAAKIIEQAMKNAGVKILYNSEVGKVIGKDKVEGVVLKDGTEIACEMIVCGIGVAGEIDWVKESGIEVNRGILADEYLQTNQPDIWAAGDIAEFKDLILEETVQLGNWANAQKQGQVAGLNMAGQKELFKFTSFYTASGFDTNIAFVGDVRPVDDRQIITRGTDDWHGRLIIKNNELIGASLINRNEEMAIIRKLIENKVDVSGKKAELAKADFDLKNLLM